MKTQALLTCVFIFHLSIQHDEASGYTFCKLYIIFSMYINDTQGERLQQQFSTRICKNIILDTFEKLDDSIKSQICFMIPLRVR